MKTAVMQPYFLPYIGYFQLIHAVDQFIVLDDVNYINRGWINRNRILVNHKPHFLTLSLKGASQNHLISQLELIADNTKRKRQIKTIYHAYKKAPFFQNVIGMIEEILLFPGKNLCQFIIHSLHKIMDYLEIETNLYVSSLIKKNNQLKGEEKILDICKIKNTDYYINPIGGTSLYHKKVFEDCGIKLYFLKTSNIVYQQFGNCFIPNLSIIDLLMFNPQSKCREFLNQYSLVEN